MCLYERLWSWPAEATAEEVGSLVQTFLQFSREVDDGGARALLIPRAHRVTPRCVVQAFAVSDSRSQPSIARTRASTRDSGTSWPAHPRSARELSLRTPRAPAHPPPPAPQSVEMVVARNVSLILALFHSADPQDRALSQRYRIVERTGGSSGSVPRIGMPQLTRPPSAATGRSSAAGPDAFSARSPPLMQPAPARTAPAAPDAPGSADAAVKRRSVRQGELLSEMDAKREDSEPEAATATVAAEGGAAADGEGAAGGSVSEGKATDAVALEHVTLGARTASPARVALRQHP